MTEEEAKTIIDIMLTADDFCPACAGNLLEGFMEYFPQFSDLAKEKYKKSYGKREFEKHFEGVK